MKEKTVQYLFPKATEAAHLKIFQEPANNVLGFYYTRDNINFIKSQPNANNYALYFLLDESDIDMTQIYVGQSTKGVFRILEHKNTKAFWSYAIMFVTNNNSFDKLTIDYLEYYFINLVKDSSSYTLNNIDKRNEEPNISMFDKAKINSFIEQILFLLKCEGVDLSLHKKHNQIAAYSAKGNFQASLYVKDGKFYLTSGSEIRRPPESTKLWKDTSHYTRYNSMINDLLKNGKVKEENGIIFCVVDIEFKAPSTAADLVSGSSENGWQFFDGLNKIRKDE